LELLDASNDRFTLCSACKINDLPLFRLPSLEDDVTIPFGNIVCG
jgi:hypothetical protein